MLKSGVNALKVCSSGVNSRSQARDCSSSGPAVGGEAVEFAQRRGRVALERRQLAEGVGELLAALRQRVDGALAVFGQPAELVVAFGERVEDDARVVDHRAHRAFLRGEDREQLVGLLDERFELGEGRVDLFAAAVVGRRGRLLPLFEGGALARLQRREDVVERHRRFDLA